jgi:adenylate cyclase
MRPTQKISTAGARQSPRCSRTSRGRWIELSPLVTLEKADHIERRLAAILSADVHGYSRMMAEDEAETVRAVKQCREIIDAHVREHRGRIVDAPGDNVLAEFASAVEAVQCAVEIQRELADRSGALEPARRMEFRIGIHVGDVILEDGKIYGDGVNIAARLEALATPGGICISSAVHEQIRGKLDIDCEDIGEQQLKNIPRPVRVLRVRIGPAPMAPTTRPTTRRRVVIGSIATLGVLATIGGAYIFLARNPHPKSTILPAAAEPSKATVAVLPFANMSASKDDEYFSDGMTDEIIGDLSQIAGMEVAARTSSFAFKGRNEDAAKIASLLHVRHLLEGSVRRSSNKVRIGVELVDASTGFTVWSEHYERDLADVFRIQAEVAERVAEKLKVRLVPDEKNRVEKQPTRNLEAYDLYLQGLYFQKQDTEDGVGKAIGYYDRAVALDPEFVLAYIQLNGCYAEAADFYMTPREAMPKARDAALKAIAIDNSLGAAHLGLASVLFLYDWDWPAADREFKMAETLDPKSEDAKLRYGWALLSTGHDRDALEQFENARRLNPSDPMTVILLGNVYGSRHEHERALAYCDEGVRMAPDFWRAFQARGLFRLGAGDPKGAIDDLEKMTKLADFPDTKGWLGFGYGAVGRRADALKILDQLANSSKTRYVPAWSFALLYAGLGDTEHELQWLETAYSDRSPAMTRLSEGEFDRIRSDSRFVALVKKVGLPEPTAAP